MEGDVRMDRTYYHDSSLGRYNTFFLYKDNGIPYLGQMSLEIDDYCRLVDNFGSTATRNVNYILVDENSRIHVQWFDIFTDRDKAISRFAKKEGI